MMDITNIYDLGYPILGTPLAEDYSIIINTNGKECALYGTIEVKDSIGTLCIYDVNPDNAEIIDKHGCLSLSNSNRAISASRRIEFYFNLRDKNENDAEFINGSFFWSDDQIPDCYDECLVEEVVGKTGLGSATVNYIVHSVAVEAVITAKLSIFEDSAAASSDGDRGSDDDGDSIMSDGDSANSDYVFGTLVARYKKRFYCDANGDEKHRIVLFNESIDTAVEMKDKCFIPLPRCIVSVPSYSSLSIEAELWRRLPNGSKEVAWTGEVEFPPSASSSYSSRGIIKGKANCGAFKVVATWFNYYEELDCLEIQKKHVLR